MAKTKTTIRDRASQRAGDLGSRVAPTVESARDKAAPLLADARDKAAPLISEARERTAPALQEAKDRLTTEVLPVLTAAVAAAGAATEDVRDESKKRGKAVAAALKGEVAAPKETHRVRNLLILLGLGGLVAFVVKKMGDRQPSTAWQSSYTPTPAGESTAAGGAHRADDASAEETSDDVGGASPDVAVADAAAAPHPATTPENPAETVHISKQ